MEIKEIIAPDISLIRKQLGAHVSRISLFGSCLSKEFTEADDIDIAIFISKLALPEATSRIFELPLTYPLRIATANGSYSKAPNKTAVGKDYHIVLLTAEKPNPIFMAMNRDKMVDL